jgi:hypothetical protein
VGAAPDVTSPTSPQAVPPASSATSSIGPATAFTTSRSPRLESRSSSPMQRVTSREPSVSGSACGAMTMATAQQSSASR